MVEEPGAVFEQLVEDFAVALDEWSEKVTQALERRGLQRKSLVVRLKPLRSVDASRVSRWLSGREQIWKGGAALPGVGLTRDLIQVLQLHGPDASLLMQLAERVDRLQWRLEEKRSKGGWRKPAGDYLQGPAGPVAEGVPKAVPPAASSITADKDAFAPLPSAIDGASPAIGRGRNQHPWPGRGKIVQVLVGGLAVVVIAGGVVAIRHEGGTQPSASAGPEVSQPAGGNGLTEPAPSESPGLEKGTLGEDSRCSPPFAGPGAVAWRVCARVEAERVSFALKITNHGGKAVTVKTRLGYAQATKFHPCPEASDTHPVSVPAGKTVITDPGQCAVARQETPFAYAGAGWVFAQDANAGSYKLSPTAHVYPDRVIWQPDLV